MNLNRNQIIAITIAILGVLIGSAAQLTGIFGPTTAKSIISVATLLNSILSSVLAVITSQGYQVQGVLDMPGVERISVNGKANKMLATLAIDQTVNKIGPIPTAVAEVTETAKGV